MRTLSSLHDYQKKVIKEAYYKKRFGIFAGVGCGKTSIALTLIHLLYTNNRAKKFIITAPKRVSMYSWDTEMDKWEFCESLKPMVINVTKSKKPAELLEEVSGDSWIMIINHDIISTLQVEPHLVEADCIIIDESSVYKSHKSKRFKHLQKSIVKTPYIYLLSGTPCPNDYHDFWSQINLLDNGRRLGKDITAFRERFCTKVNRYWVYKVKRSKRNEVLNRIKDITFFMTAKDKIELPDITFKDYYYDLPITSERAYLEMMRHNITVFNNHEIVGTNDGVKVDKLLQISLGMAYDDNGGYVRLHASRFELLKEVVGTANNVIIVYNYKSELRRLEGMFPQGKNIKDITEDEWNSGRVRVLFIHPKSAGHGLNLQFGGSHIVFSSFKYSFEQYDQVIGRVYRMGQKEPVVISRLLMNPVHIETKRNGDEIYHSIDERVASVLDDKEENSDNAQKILGRYTIDN